MSPAKASACSGGGEATTGKPFGKISYLGLTEGGVLLSVVDSRVVGIRESSCCTPWGALQVPRNP